MNVPAVPMVAAVTLAVAGLALWTWFTLAGMRRAVRASAGFKGMHFEE